jgi:two-component system chemotaxis response regulator CheY
VAAADKTGVTSGARVLIVDDATFVRGLVAAAVTDAGHVVAGEARDGAEALSRYADLRPDLVTLDVATPAVEGVPALAAIRALDPAARVLVCAKPCTREGLIGELAIALRG